MNVPIVCRAAIALIVACEVSGPATFKANFAHPCWPGGDSGVTIGIGYDLGYESRADLDREWPMLDAAVRERLSGVLGIKGRAAEAALDAVKDIDISYEAATASFELFTLPRYAAQTASAFPGAASAPPECFGALVSLVYNRGASMAGEKRREMAAIRDMIAAGNLASVPEQFEAMCRLWPSMRGLRDRRKKEADLWRTGLGLTPRGV